MILHASRCLPDRVQVCEVGPRDGLQSEPQPVATADKIRYIELLAESGLRSIEVSSFVSPRWVPQLADHAEVLRGLRRRPGVRYVVLVPNDKGLDNALAAGADAIAVFTGATETFTRKNINQSIEESLARFARIAERAHAAGCWVRGYISCAFGCPYEGEVAPGRVVEIAARLRGLGCDEIAFGDTIGTADPVRVGELLGRLEGVIPLSAVALHLHDTYGMALVNVFAALQYGVRIFDAASGGLGGCPFAPGAAGNLATEDLLWLLERLGIETGVDLERVLAASRFIEERLGRTLPGRVLRARLSAGSCQPAAAGGTSTGAAAPACPADVQPCARS
ncbi:MAG: hydroxymethylglutaryl-CoA lyase [Planctomycetota bacterium]|nr:MAG: hydroxymethylglutaryl-CoA lyase [Planctomycetota bacterium]